MRRSLLWVAFVSVSLVGCSGGVEDNSASRAALQDITKPGANGTNILFWQDQSKVFRGQCPEGKPMIRANCQTSIVSLERKQAEEKAGLKGKEKVLLAQGKIIAEIKKLKSQDPTVQSLTSQMESLKAEKTKLDGEVTVLKKVIVTNQTSQTKTDEQLAYTVQQLAAVDKALSAEPTREDLLQLKAKLLEEKKTLSSASTGLTADRTSLETRLAHASKTSEAAGFRADALYKELTAFTTDLVVTSDVLRALTKELATLEESVTSFAAVFKLIETADLTFRSGVLTPAENLTLEIISEVIGASPSSIRPGYYVVKSGYNYYPQQLSDITTTQNGLRFKVSYGGGTPVLYSCSKSECFDAQKYQKLVITSAEEYTFSSANGSNPAFFTWKSDKP